MDKIIPNMDTESSVAVSSHKENCNSLVEIFNVERRMWTSVQSKGLLSADVRNIYRKTCGLYEKIFLGYNELEELQETEYSLWKLHYRQIDEFRKQTSQRPESIQKGCKLFLEESSRFYQDLISKFKKHYGFKDLDLFYHSHADGISSSIEHVKLHKCRLVCHRLLVRLGDLARYLEVNQNRGIGQRNWSAVAQCYFEAAKMYPDGGNPQNQLALLATPAYIGDELLALYHCVRSMAVKEPFPDASDNLLFIFERNMSVDIHSLSVGSEFNFLKPSERVMTTVPALASKGACYLDADFWSLFVRLTSFFFLELSFESFSRTFASTIRELEALLALDDAKLSLALESYQNVNISRLGPYRALQVVSVLIFTVQNLSGNSELQCLKKQQMALIVTFICVGRIVERCLKGISTDDFPLLPTVMVFSEWLVEFLERVDKCEIDENLMSAMSYFISSYAELLNQLLEGKSHVESPNLVALWEDYEMRGFLPVSQCHSSLDFSTHWENEANFRARNEYRIHRIIHAAIKMAKRSTDGLQSWIFYEEGGKFCTKKAKESSDVAAVSMVEEEEDIVFKPIDRYSSAPLSAHLRRIDGISQESGRGLKQLVSDESLRHASSLLIAQNRALISSLTSHTGLPGTHLKPSMLSTATEAPPSSGGRPGPPSLSAWVLNNNTKEDILKPINEISASAKCSSPHYNYCPSTPSAPLLPKDATWSTGIPGPKLPSYTDNSLFNHSVLPPPPPWPRGLRYRQNLQCIDPSQRPTEASTRINHFEQRYPLTPIPAVYTESTVSMHPSAPFVCGLHEQPRENALYDHHTVYERLNPNVYGTGMDVGADQQQLLQYLKEKECRIQQEAQIAHYNTRS